MRIGDKLSRNFSINELPSNYKFYGIDVMKFICAYMVCIIHINPFSNDFLGMGEDLNFWIRQYICRLAVPFYFTVSGFLLFRKMEFRNPDQERIKDYCFRNLRLLGTWTFLIFIGSKDQLWYLGALVLAVLILNFLVKSKLKLKYIVLISTACFAIGLIGDSYKFLIEPLTNKFLTKIIISGYYKLFETTRNGLFFGLIFVLMGALFANKRIKLNNKLAFLGFCSSMVLMFFEANFLRKQSIISGFNMMISLIPAVFFLFSFTSHLRLKPRHIYNRLRIVGVLIFYTHLFVRGVVKEGFKIISNRIGVDLTPFLFIATAVATTVLAIIIERLSQKEKFKWLKYIYS